MITFLWILYLAFTLYITVITIKGIVHADTEEQDLNVIVRTIITCILWAI